VEALSVRLRHQSCRPSIRRSLHLNKKFRNFAVGSTPPPIALLIVPAVRAMWACVRCRRLNCPLRGLLARLERFGKTLSGKSLPVWTKLNFNDCKGPEFEFGLSVQQIG